jgi:hypothetical protein
MSDRPATEREVDTRPSPPERLAKELFLILEHFDATDEPEWEQLSEHQKDIYRATIDVLLSRRDLSCSCISVSESYRSIMNGHVKVSE